jgi:aspartate aminotransferase
MVKMANGIPVTIETTIENDFKITAAEFEAAITPNTRMMIFSSPCNPSGSVYTHDELAQMAEVLKRHPQIVVISDEIYEIINFTGKHASLASFDFIRNQVVTVNGASKGFAMTGWRLGYMGAPLAIAKACNKIQGQLTSAPSSISQMACKAAVEADPSVVDYMKDSFLKRRDLVLKGLEGIPGLITNVPQGAFYIFPDVSAFFGKRHGDKHIENAEDLCNYLLEEEYVALVTGDAFGAPNCVRISYAASEKELTEACARIRRALMKLH